MLLGFINQQTAVKLHHPSPRHVEDCDEDENQQNYRCDDEAQHLKSSAAPAAASCHRGFCSVAMLQWAIHEKTFMGYVHPTNIHDPINIPFSRDPSNIPFSMRYGYSYGIWDG